MSEMGPKWLVGTVRPRRCRSAAACLLVTATAGALVALPLSTVPPGNPPPALPRLVVVATRSAPLTVSIPLGHWMDTERELSAPKPNSAQPLTLNVAERPVSGQVERAPRFSLRSAHEVGDAAAHLGLCLQRLVVRMCTGQGSASRALASQEGCLRAGWRGGAGSLWSWRSRWPSELTSSQGGPSLRGSARTSRCSRAR
jgi:hypothetical protein